MGNHGVWADDEISCITITALQLFIMYTSTGCALKLASPKHYPNSVHKIHSHNVSMWSLCIHPVHWIQGKYMYQVMSAYLTD